MERLFWICCAGALGSGTRYLVGGWASQRLGGAFPYGTLLVNVAGCFLIALVLEVAADASSFPPNLRFALSTGFLGGLTTYSSFNHETLKLLEDGAPKLALLNFAATTVACVVAGLVGLALARRLSGG